MNKKKDKEKGSDKRRVHARIQRVIGQLQGVSRMIEAEAPCEEIMAQISAVSAAIHKAAEAMMESHIRTCVKESVPRADADQTVGKFATALSRFVNMK